MLPILSILCNSASLAATRALTLKARNKTQSKIRRYSSGGVRASRDVDQLLADRCEIESRLLRQKVTPKRLSFSVVKKPLLYMQNHLEIKLQIKTLETLEIAHGKLWDGCLEIEI